uniref:Uncharacterized protein n=1 Tax=Tanacetum cinerariifolium TaxID=118510 RepID=A0A6L2JTP7_TANCI|nr:hypothetical protein [Tanacetum cinerariifolium]
MWETNSYKAHEDHMITKKEEKRHDLPKTPPGSPPHQPPPLPLPAGPSGTLGSPGAFGSSQLPPPPLPPSTSQSDHSKSTAALSSSKTAASTEYTAWMTTNTRLELSVSSILADVHMDDDTALDRQVHLSDDEDTGNSHIPKASALVSTYTPLPENSLLVQTDEMAIFMDWYNVNKALPLGGPPGQVTIQYEFFNKDLKYLRYGSKGGKPALSISKMKATYYPDVSLEQMVPDQMWIEKECKYTSEGDRRAVRTDMWILSVVRIKVFSMYGIT